VSETTTTTQAAVLDGVQTAQKLVIDGLTNLADLVRPAIDTLPEIPFVQSLPTPAEVVENGFDFAAKLLAAQRDFAAQVAAVLAPQPQA